MLENALENTGHALAVGTSRLPPWWRFRLYHHLHKRLLGDPYWCDQASQPSRWTRIYPHGYEMELSAADWMEDGWDIESSVRLAEILKAKGVEFTREPTTVRPGVRICFIRGPEGVSIELLDRNHV